MSFSNLPDLPESFRELTDSFLEMKCRYQSALREVRTKLEILDDEFQMRNRRNPIHHMESRIKSPGSLLEKFP